jgi:hypothetical protein
MLESIKKIPKALNLDTIDEQKSVFAFIFLFFNVSLIITFTFKGTGDAGDAISHYQYAHWFSFSFY